MDKKTLERWRLMKRDGDVKDLVQITGSSYPTIKKALDTGKANKLVLKEIEKYYKARARKILEAISN